MGAMIENVFRQGLMTKRAQHERLFPRLIGWGGFRKFERAFKIVLSPNCARARAQLPLFGILKPGAG